MSAATMCDTLEVTEAEFRADHPGLLEKLEALTDDQIEWLLVYLRAPRWQRPVWRFRNWLRRPRASVPLADVALLLFVLAVAGSASPPGHAITQPKHAVTDSYGWPQAGVTQHGPDCLAAASVTFLEAYGVHVSQFRFAPLDPGASVGHAAVIINGYLRPQHVRVIVAGAMDAAELRLVLEASGRPVLVTLHSEYLPWWRGYPGGHEVVIDKLTITGVRLWDPSFGWQTTSVGSIAAGAWEYLIPVQS